MSDRPLAPSMVARIRSNAVLTARKRALAGDAYTLPVPVRFALRPNHQRELQSAQLSINRHGRSVWL